MSYQQTKCRVCNGTGKVACKLCNGTGLSGDVHAPCCFICGGQGKNPCIKCEGVGVLRVRRATFRGWP